MNKKLFFTVAMVAVMAAHTANAQSGGDYKSSKGEANLLQDAERIETPVMKTTEVAQPEPAQEPVVETATYSDLTGFYAGVQAGYTWGNADVDLAGGPDGDVDTDGFDGGVFAGYGYEHQMGGMNGYIGAEVAYDWSDVDGEFEDVSFSKDEALVATVRPGMRVNENVLGYGIVGYSRAKFKGASGDEKLDGLVLGAGAEFDTGTKVKARLDYTFTNYEEADLDGTDFDGHESSIQAGALMRF